MDVEKTAPVLDGGDRRQEERQETPFVIFKVKGSAYCVDSRYIETLLQVPAYESLPDAPPAVRGIFPHRDGFITMYDMRTAFGQESMQAEFDGFAAMLDRRKEEHIRWVEALERSVRTGEAFTMSRDPHACAFGKWYDSFQSEQYSINAHLKKIDQPHQELHHSADQVDACRDIQDPEQRKQRLEELLTGVRDRLMPAIVKLLDETKDVFRASMFREMALILRGTRLGLIVDEVQRVEYLQPSRREDALETRHKSPYLLGVRRSGQSKAALLELNVPELLRAAGVEAERGGGSVCV